MKLLMVDRSAFVRAVGARALAPDGWEVFSAADGAEALEVAQRVQPDIILVDPVCERPDGDPGPGGAAFCQAIRGISSLRHVPIVLTVAEADNARWKQECGVDQVVVKPFKPGQLRTAVAKARQRPSPHDGQSEPLASVELRQELESLRALPATPDSSALWEHARRIAALVNSVDGDVSFRGRLEHLPLGDVLQLMQQGQTGRLVVERPGRRVELYLGEGAIDIVLARGLGAEFRLGSYLMRMGALGPNELRAAESDDGWLGLRLLRMGAIEETELRSALVAQAQERVYEALRWTSGTFEYHRHLVCDESEDAKLQVSMQATLMEGLQRVDEWRLIHEQLPSRDLVLHREVSRGEAQGPVVERVFAEVDGKRTIAEIGAMVGLSSFDVAKALYTLLTNGSIRL